MEKKGDQTSEYYRGIVQVHRVKVTLPRIAGGMYGIPVITPGVLLASFTINQTTYGIELNEFHPIPSAG
jgi:hypothetical protein